LKENGEGSKRTINLTQQINEISSDRQIQNHLEIEKEKIIEKLLKQTTDNYATTTVSTTSTAKKSLKPATDSNATTTVFAASPNEVYEQSALSAEAYLKPTSNEFHENNFPMIENPSEQSTDSNTTTTGFTTSTTEFYEQSASSAEAYLTTTSNEFHKNNYSMIEKPLEQSTDSNTTTTGFTTSTIKDNQQSALSTETCLMPNSNDFPMISLTEADLRTELMEVDETVSSPQTTLTADLRTQISQSQLIDICSSTIASTIATNPMNKSCIDASDHVAGKCSFINSQFSTAMVDLEVRTGAFYEDVITTVKPSADLPISSTQIAQLVPDPTSISPTPENETDHVSESFLSGIASKSTLAATSNVDIRDENLESQNMEENDLVCQATASEKQLVGNVAMPTFETTKIDLNVKTPLEDSPKNFQCTFCYKLLKGKISLRNHTNHNHIDKKLECQKCKKLFTSSHRLVRFFHYKT